MYGDEMGMIIMIRLVESWGKKDATGDRMRSQ